jgi:hypothetical protein
LKIRNDTVVFHAPEINQSLPEILDYLKGILQQLKYFNSFEKREMLYQCKDAPIFYFYLFPEIGAFKTFCWVKTVLNDPRYQDKVFSFEEFPFTDCFKIGQEILKEYNILPSVELWNFESLSSTINQIEYYRSAGLFKSDEDFISVLASLEKSIDHLQEQAKYGVKFMPGAADTGHKASFKIYVNEVIMGNNTFILDLDGKLLAIITYNALNYLLTKDIRFTLKSIRGFNTLVSRSTLISSVGEKERNKFFRGQREKIAQLKK